MSKYYLPSRPEAAFNRRRCPCGSGLFKRTHYAGNPNMRICTRCGTTFDLFKQGVKPDAAPKKAPAKGSGIFPAAKDYSAEIKPLKREWDAHMRLCQEGRK